MTDRAPRRLPTIGLFGINMHACAGPDAAGIAALAERLGYDSVWAGEHIVLPSPRTAASPMDPDEPMLDPIVSLTFATAATKHLRLGTGIIILPQRNPVVLAKQLASLDAVSAGRLDFGIGVGYLEPELKAIGVPVDERIEMAEEYLAAMQSLWYDEAPAFNGRYVSFSGIDAQPRPVQRPIPIIMGGRSRAAHRRTVQLADGWYGFFLDLETTKQQIDSIREQARRFNRDRPIEISVTPGVRLTTETVAQFADLGVDRLIVLPRSRLTLAELERFVEANAPGQVGATPAPWV